MQKKIGRYEIRRELGRGGMATVYHAFDPQFQCQVAIKVLPRQLTHDPKYLGRFKQEAQMIAKLEHPAIVPVYDFGEQDDAPYLVMRYMSGGSLRDRLRGEPLSIDEITAALERLAAAIDYAHESGIIHRDLKPANVFFDHQGRPCLADFGIARLAEASQTMTVVGTPAYMSPEQVEGDQLPDGRADIYALGVMLYEALTGVQPYTAETLTKQMVAHILQPVPNILEANPDLAPQTQEIIDKAMAKDREERYATASELVADVKALREADSSAVDPTEAGDVVVAAATAAVMTEKATPEPEAEAPGDEPASDDASSSVEEAAIESVVAAVAVAEKASGLDRDVPAFDGLVEDPANTGATSPPSSPPTDAGSEGRGLPGWIWWVGALALLLIAVLSIRAILGGDAGDEVAAVPATATVEEAEETATATLRDIETLKFAETPTKKSSPTTMPTETSTIEPSPTPIPTETPTTGEMTEHLDNELVATAKGGEGDCAIYAVDLIGSWVESGVPEKATFDYTSVDDEACSGTFETDIQPLFTEKNVWSERSQACTGCHSSNSENSYSEMDLRSYEGIMAGSNMLSEPPGVPILGQSEIGADDYDWEHSKLRARLRNNRMPPGWDFDLTEKNRNGPALLINGRSVRAVDLLADWVDAGAPEMDSFGDYSATFEGDVLPLYTEDGAWFEGSQACTGCHFGNTDNSLHEMDLSSYEGIMAGSDVLSEPPGVPILGQSEIGADDYDWDQSKMKERLRNNRMPPGIEFDITEENRDGLLVAHGKLAAREASATKR